MTMPEAEPPAASFEERQIRVQEGELALKREQFAAERKKGVLGNAAVMITIVGGVSAILFQAAGVVTAQINLETAKQQATNDWDFRGLELFVHDEDKLVSCDGAETAAEVSLFQSMFPRLLDELKRVASAKAQACIAQQGDAAAAATKGPGAAGASDQARYAALASFAPALSSAPSARPTVYIQISDEAERPDAVRLQQALAAQGYAAPGVQRVATSPSEAQLRYYHDDQTSTDQANTAAAQIAAILHTPKPQVLVVPGHYSNLPYGIVEYWFKATAG